MYTLFHECPLQRYYFPCKTLLENPGLKVISTNMYSINVKSIALVYIQFVIRSVTENKGSIKTNTNLILDQLIPSSSIDSIKLSNKF